MLTLIYKLNRLLKISVLCRHVTCFQVVFATNFTDNLTPNGTALQSSSYQKPRGNAEYAIFPPASNQFTDRTCSQTVTMQNNREAWWMFQFSFGFAHITDIIIYYREGCTYICKYPKVLCRHILIFDVCKMQFLIVIYLSWDAFR